MLGKPNSTRQRERRQATIDEIVATAWELAREQGLAGFSLRDLGARVGMRAQSLYTYFSSKSDIYDAMFLDGNRAFLAAMDGLEPLPGDDPAAAVEAARAIGHRFFDFCTADPVRYQLLFQRTIPDFTPSSASYSVAQQVYDRGVAAFAEIGATAADVDVWTAVLTGLVSQQLANDPGGDRWKQLVDRAADMVLTHVASGVGEVGSPGNRRQR